MRLLLSFPLYGLLSPLLPPLNGLLLTIPLLYRLLSFPLYGLLLTFPLLYKLLSPLLYGLLLLLLLLLGLQLRR